MGKIFLHDIVSTVSKRGAVTGTKYYNIIVPELSKNSTLLVLEDDTSISLSNDNDSYSFMYKTCKFVIRGNFTDYFDKEKIKHSFHKTTTIIHRDDIIDKIDLYFNNSSEGFR